MKKDNGHVSILNVYRKISCNYVEDNGENATARNEAIMHSMWGVAALIKLVEYEIAI